MASQKGDLKAGTYEIKLGGSWDTPVRDRTTFHTLKYDFKPKSVANETETYVAMGQNNDVQVAVPAENDTLTMYKGGQKQVKEAKECLLFFNPKTGEVRLEKVSSNITVKKTRPGDAEPATEQYLRSEIARLRSTCRPPPPEENEMSSSMMNEDPERKRTASSSSSSSSSSDGSSSSSDESEDGDNFRDAPPLNTTSSLPPHGFSSSVPPPRSGMLSSASSPMEMSDSDEDDEMSKQLEREMTSMGGSAAPSSSHAPCESMPQLDISSPPRAPLPPPSTSKSTSLFNDLALSESSDDDD
ncbi:hypothetical protein PMAYCL1PPCAC_24274 [Pristionchus mayeri]|uniref:Ell-associated factor Eaf n=1 Tax=Pristionchus mayeri TaxID=1317129 RepID=A0AAN5CZU8_9BILA|nr:hypothetical protein PMAYCL1PPCAC_24274 [Pristionchus mayeri]